MKKRKKRTTARPPLPDRRPPPGGFLHAGSTYPTTPIMVLSETPRHPLSGRAASIARRARGEGSLGRQECDNLVFGASTMRHASE
jgi:hypothetical protein